MFQALITRNGQQVHIIPAKTEQAAEFKALDYIDDMYDAGNENAHTEYDYTIVEAGPVQPQAWTAVFMTRNEAYNQETNPVDLTNAEYGHYMTMQEHASYSYMRYWRKGDDPKNCGYHFFNGYKRP